MELWQGVLIGLDGENEKREKKNGVHVGVRRIEEKIGGTVRNRKETKKEI